MISGRALQQATQTLFPPGIEVGLREIGKAEAAWPVEAAAVAAAVPTRKAEFAAGRAAVRDALCALGLPPVAVPMGEDRAPLWPSGVVGSITHAAGFALAAVAPARQCRGIGLDLEGDTPLDEGLLKTVCLPEERKWLTATDDPLGWAKLVFSAKEAAYKCQFASSHTIFGFDTIIMGVDGPKNRLIARFVSDVPPFARGARIEGRFLRQGGVILTGFVMPRAMI